MNNEADSAKSLGLFMHREARSKLLDEPHVKPLTEFVQKIRSTKNLTVEIPYFDPFDGGTNARVLFILEAPGAKAVQSGFISCNNPDETAKNMLGFIRDSGFARNDIAIWNIVPWYIGTGTKIRPANQADVLEGLGHLENLIKLFANLETIVFVGKKSQKAMKTETIRNDIKRYAIDHPSPLFVNNKPENRSKILDAMTSIRAKLK